MLGPHSRLNRRDFVRLSAAGIGVGAITGLPRRARAASAYPDWIAASTKTPRRGGVLTRATAWDPPVIDPRLTQSVGLFQFAGLNSNRLLRYVFTDEASGYYDLSLKGDLADSWQGSPDQRVWTFKLRRGVRWHNVHFFRVNDPVVDELTSKLRRTPDRAEQRALAKKLFEREHDQVLRMWMPYDDGFLNFQPHVRNAAALAIRRTDAYGSPTIARVWLDKWDRGEA